MHISGNNLQHDRSRMEYSYYFSKYTHIWGWASWRRAWKYYDVDIKTWPEFKKQGMISANCEDIHEQKYWTDIFDHVCSGVVDTWDYQWLYTCWSQNGLSILPSTNLVSNIGFGEDATHTLGDSPLANIPTSDIWDIKHPPYVVRNKHADMYAFDNHFGGRYMKQANKISLRRILSRGKRLLMKFAAMIM